MKSGREGASPSLPVEPEKIQVEDFEAQPRRLEPRAARIVSVLSVGLSLFQLYTSWEGPFNDFVQRSIHLAFVFPLVFLMYPFSRRSRKKDGISIADRVLFGLSLAATLWVTVNNVRLLENPGDSETADLILGLVMILVVLEGSRRILGLALPLIGCLLIGYALLGPYFPGMWKHRGFSLPMILEPLYLSNNGIWGFVVGISATVIAGFLIFGVVLSRTGGADTFVDLSLRIAGRSYGGAAKVSCFSSAFFGTVSGSAVANVVVDGVFNIPLMKSLGYRKEFAGAVEATTSSGGQIMPPVMGAGAFIMAEILRVPYAQVAISAIVPALLYYLCCYMGIHFEAKRLGLKPVPSELIPSFRKKILPKSAPFFFPVALLVYLLTTGHNSSLSVLYSVLLSIGILLIPKKNDRTLRQKVNIIIQSLDEGGRTIVMIAALCAAAQIIVGMLTITGLGIKISTAIINLSGGQVLPGLFFAMIVAIILGMGVPTTAAYVLASSVVIPSLVNIGIPPLSAHMFVFYFAILSAITPPVCPAVYVSSAIAHAHWWPTALIACRLGLAGFIVPYMFYYAPALLLQGDVTNIILNCGTAFMGVVTLSAGVMGFFLKKLTVVERLVMTGCGFFLIDPNVYTDIAALVVLGYFYFSQRFAKDSIIEKPRRTDPIPLRVSSTGQALTSPLKGEEANHFPPSQGEGQGGGGGKPE